MRVKLIRIGNSPGILIPNKLIKLLGLGDVVDVNVTPEGSSHCAASRATQRLEAVLCRSPPGRDRDPARSLSAECVR